MEYRSIQKNVGDSPRKMRLVADMIRKMSPEQAIETLQFTNRAAAIPLAKAIKTAIANTKGLAGLHFKSIEINEGLKIKRYRVGTAGRGRGRPYRKRFSHIKIVLTDEIINAKLQMTNKEKRSAGKKTEEVKETVEQKIEQKADEREKKGENSK